MAKRPFVVNEEEEPIDLLSVIDTSPEALEKDAEKFALKFRRKYGKSFPRLVSALFATSDDDS